MLKELIRQGVDKLDLKLPALIIDKLITYHDLLIKWNKVYNLTAITNSEEIIKKHILDSLSIIKYIDDLENINIIDVGSGAGLPGIIISIVRPDLKITVLDSNSKKTAFSQQVKISLNLNNLNVVNNRAENYLPQELYNIIISRAFASLTDYVDLVKHMLAPAGVILAMKGKLPNEEILEFNNNKDKYGNFMISDTIKVRVPFLTDSRYLIKIEKVL